MQQGATGVEKLFAIGFILMIAGALVVAAAALAATLRSGGEGRYGAVILIGPIPIIVGNDSSTVKLAVIGAIILMALAITLMLLPGLLLRRSIPAG